MKLVKIGDLWINLDQVILIDDEGAQIVLSFVGAIAGEEPYLSGVGFFKDSEGWSLVNLRKPSGTQYLQIDLSRQRSYTAHMGPSPKNLPLKGTP